MSGAEDLRREGFVRVGRLPRLRRGRGRQFMLDVEPVAVFRTHDDRYLAIGDTCPHMGTSLADGPLHEDGCVECTWHHWRFDAATGKSDERDWARVAVYGIRVVDGEVWLRPPDEPVEPTRPKLPEPNPEPWVKWDDAFLKRGGPDGDA